MGDVTAVVLSIGEPYVERALASVRRQTFGPMPIVRIVDVRPFYRAMNEAAARVGTPFFLQLDADMIANNWCVEELRAAMQEGVGMAAAPLWDPLMGVEPGIKLFRTESVRQLRFRNHLSPDVDFYQRLPQHGWRAAFVLPGRLGRWSATPWPTFGRHEPDYTPTYTYTRFHRLGARYRRRSDVIGMQWRYQRLLGSTHTLALLARIALVAGVFHDRGERSDEWAHDRVAEDALWMHRFLNQAASAAVHTPHSAAAGAAYCETFTDWHDIGAHCRTTLDASAFRYRLAAIDRSQHSAIWYARLGLCHGLVFGACGTQRLRTSCEALKKMLGAETGRPAA